VRGSRAEGEVAAIVRSVSAVDILVAIVALGLVIALHELGHYAAAVACGMKVDRFSVFGIGPPIAKLGTWRGTEFVVSAIPFGAYVMIRGMEAADEDNAPAELGSFNFRDKPLYQRALVIVGGPLMNYLVAILLYVALFAGFGVDGPPRAIEIAAFVDDSPAQRAGLELGDELVQLGEMVLEPASANATTTISSASEPYRGEPMGVVVRRGGELVNAVVEVPQEGLALGIKHRLRRSRERVPFVTALEAAFVKPFSDSAEQLYGWGQLITGRLTTTVQGPVRIVTTMAESASGGLADFVAMTALISTLLGMINLVPLPALDGGRLAFLGYEALARRRADSYIEELIHGYGMMALLLLLACATVGDIRSFF